MIINKEEVEEAAKENCECNQASLRQYDKHFIEAFKAGVEFSEEYVQKHVQDIIIENQGLKLYKDNEAERFKELAVEFAEFIIDYEKTPHLNRLETTEELYELFLKQRNEKN